MHSAKSEKTTAVWREKITPYLVSFSACTMMFCLPWAGNVDLPFSGLISLGFNLSAAVLVALWFAVERRPFQNLPWAFSFFVLYFLIHTIIVHGLIFPSELFDTNLVYIGTRVKEISSPILLILRAVLFFLVAYSVSALCLSRTLLKNMALALSVSVMIILLLGGNSFASPTGVRFSGGYANPNSFASVVVLMAYLVAFVMSDKGFSRITRLIAGCFLVVAVVIILMTASRSALVGLLGGGLAILFLEDWKTKIVYLVIFSGILFFVLIFAPSNLVGFAFGRFSSGESSGRFFIWLSYLQQWREYFLYGVGFGREMTVLKTVTYHGVIWAPHNTYLRVLVDFGTIGLVLFWSFLWGLFARIINLQKQPLIGFGPKLLLAFFTTITIQIFFGDYLVNRSFGLILGIIGAYISVYSRDHKTK